MFKKFSFLAFLLILGMVRPLKAESLFNIEKTLLQGNYVTAEEQLQQSLSRTPHDPRLLDLQARLRLNQGRIEESISIYQTISLPDDPIEQLRIINNFWLTLDYQERLMVKRLKFLEKDRNPITIPMEGELRGIRSQKAQLARQGLSLADGLSPSLLVAQIYLHVGELTKSENTLRSLPPSEQKARLAGQSTNISFLLEKLAEFPNSLPILTQLARLDPNFLPQAIEVALASGNDEVLFQLFALQGNLGINPQESYRAAVASLSRLRPALVQGNPQTQLFFQEKVIPVYRGYLAVLLADPTQENLREARGIFERLQIAQVENLLNKLCLVTDKEGIEVKLSKINAAMVHLIVLQENTHVLVSLPSGEIKHHRVEMTEQEMENLGIEWRKNLQNPALRDYFREGAIFYDKLIRPVQSSFEGSEQLIFVSDGILRTIPPQAFFDLQSQQFLIEQVGAIRTLLSSAFLRDIREDSGILLGFGLSEPRPPFYSSLPYVKSELAFIEQVVQNSTVVINDGFTVDSVRRDLLTKDPQILHIASHALFSGDPRTSLLATYQEAINLFELESLLSVASSLDLLVLSACETSQGDNLSVLGLAGVAVQANVKSVVGTLWKADDRGASELVREFYQRLAQGDSVALSLAEAQRNAIQQGVHASDWALMLLLG